VDLAPLQQYRLALDLTWTENTNFSLTHDALFTQLAVAFAGLTNNAVSLLAAQIAGPTYSEDPQPETPWYIGMIPVYGWYRAGQVVVHRTDGWADNSLARMQIAIDIIVLSPTTTVAVHRAVAGAIAAAVGGGAVVRGIFEPSALATRMDESFNETVIRDAGGGFTAGGCRLSDRADVPLKRVCATYYRTSNGQVAVIAPLIEVPTNPANPTVTGGSAAPVSSLPAKTPRSGDGQPSGWLTTPVVLAGIGSLALVGIGVGLWVGTRASEPLPQIPGGVWQSPQPGQPGAAVPSGPAKPASRSGTRSGTTRASSSAPEASPFAPVQANPGRRGTRRRALRPRKS
jgi:hypothetical protein